MQQPISAHMTLEGAPASEPLRTCRVHRQISAEAGRVKVNTMRGNGYHSDELKSFHRVLDSAISEAKSHCLDLPVTEMTERLFSAADNGGADR